MKRLPKHPTLTPLRALNLLLDVTEDAGRIRGKGERSTQCSLSAHEYELLEPSTRRPDGRYPVPRRRYGGHNHPAPVGPMAECQSLDIDSAMVVLPESVKVDPYAEHRKKIGDDK